MKTKKIAYKLHLWLGIPCSVFIFIICLTGSLFVFSDDIVNMSNRNISTVAPLSERVPLDDMVEHVKKSFPHHILLYCVNYKEENKATLFVVANKEEGQSYVYVNPYDGHITGRSRMINFFSHVAHFHKQLFLGSIGSIIVLICSFIFLLELITGIILWRPGKKKGLKFNMIHMHRTIGVYFIIVMSLLSVTGILLYLLPHNGIEAQKKEKTEMIRDSSMRAMSLNSIIEPLMQDHDVSVVRTELWNIAVSKKIQCIAGTRSGLVTFNGKPCFIDKYTGEKITDNPELRQIELRNTVRRLHVGDWLGWFGKFITFLTGLAGAFLAFSGIFIWCRKLKRRS